MTWIWRRQGLILAPPGTDAWASHAQAPTPLVLGPRLWRVYVGGRGRDNRSRIFRVDLDPGAGMAVLQTSCAPVLELGPPGAFDSAGQCASAVMLRPGGQVWIWYVGMHLRRDVPYGLAVGLAVSDDGGLTFRRGASGPVIASGPEEPWFCSVAHVTQAGPGDWHAWYMSGTGWTAPESPGADPDPLYGLAQARSADGIAWRRAGPGLALPGQALTRPWALADRLVFSARATAGFRDDPAAGYRLMEVGLSDAGDAAGTPRPLRLDPAPAPGDWDHAMQCYAAILPHDGGEAMLYNGAGFGHAGFGWATREAR